MAGGPPLSPVKRHQGGFSWRLPALAITVALIGLVVVARLNMPVPPAPAPSRLPLASPTAVAEASPSRPPLTPAPSRQIWINSPSPLEFVPSPWPDRYADGIPRTIDGNSVVRLNAALQMARQAAPKVAGPLMVGSWFAGLPDADGCSALAYEPWCRQGRLADTPAGFGRNEGVVAVDGMPAIGPGPLVVVATATADCPADLAWDDPALCTYALHAQQVLWRGDAYTAASPIGVGPLFSAIAALMWFDPQPFHADATCQLAQPRQSYATQYGLVQLAFIFPTTAERRSLAPAVVNKFALADQAGDCVVLAPMYSGTGWLRQDNVLLRVANPAGQTGDTIRHLLGELSLAAELQGTTGH
jgi:hypothetical protein